MQPLFLLNKRPEVVGLCGEQAVQKICMQKLLVNKFTLLLPITGGKLQ